MVRHAELNPLPSYHHTFSSFSVKKTHPCIPAAQPIPVLLRQGLQRLPSLQCLLDIQILHTIFHFMTTLQIDKMFSKRLYYFNLFENILSKTLNHEPQISSDLIRPQECKVFRSLASYLHHQHSAILFSRIRAIDCFLTSNSQLDCHTVIPLRANTVPTAPTVSSYRPTIMH